MKTKARIGIGVLAVALLVILLTESVVIPKQLQGDVLPLEFKGYRDDTTLTAVFEMHNQSGSPVVVWENARLINGETDKEIEWITLERTVIPENKSGTLVVEPPRDSIWRVEFSVARFGPRQQRKFEAGRTVKGTVCVSAVVPKFDSTQ